MDNFKVIYKILKFLERQMQTGSFDGEGFNAEAFGINEGWFNQLLIELQASGYIRGLRITASMSSDEEWIAKPVRPRITIQGLEFLEENSAVRKAAAALKGIKDIIPGV